MFEIREGNIADLPLIVEKAKIFNELAKDGYGKFLTYDPLSVSENIAKVVGAGGKYWVLWKDDEFAGIVMGMVTPNFFNSAQNIANCLFVAVLPEFQKTRWGSKLMNKFEEWGKESGADFIAYTGYEKKFFRSVRRRGFVKTETRLMKRI